jgi:hypothetical protein
MRLTILTGLARVTRAVVVLTTGQEGKEKGYRGVQKEEAMTDTSLASSECSLDVNSSWLGVPSLSEARTEEGKRES